MIRLTRRADHDLSPIYAYGADRFGIAQAERYYASLRSTLTLLASSPRISRLRTEFRPPVRIHHHLAHLIVYVEQEPGILVVRVLHARRDYKAALN